MDFERVAIVGVGLIGGSLAAALRALPAERRPVVLGVADGAETREYALEHGIVDEALDPEAAVGAGWLSAGHGPRAADLVILAALPAATVDWLRRLGELGYDGVVTDVASTKATIVAAAAEYLHDAVFIGGHPMAGSERSGVTAARPDLFVDAHYVLTPCPDTPPDTYRALHALATSVGARVVAIDPAVHDEAVAVVSHAPHVAAAAITGPAAARAGVGGRHHAAGGRRLQGHHADRRGQPGTVDQHLPGQRFRARRFAGPARPGPEGRSPWRWRRVTPRQWTSGSRGPPRSPRDPGSLGARDRGPDGALGAGHRPPWRGRRGDAGREPRGLQHRGHRDRPSARGHGRAQARPHRRRRPGRGSSPGSRPKAMPRRSVRSSTTGPVRGGRVPAAGRP